VQSFLQPAVKGGIFDLWVDRQMTGGADWQQEIEDKLRGQAIAALLGQQRQAFETAELAERLDEAMPEDDLGVIRVSIVGNPEHTRQIAKATEEAARRRRADDRE